MSIPPSKKRKVDSGSNGAKLVSQVIKTISAKGILKSQISKSPTTIPVKNSAERLNDHPSATAEESDTQNQDEDIQSDSDSDSVSSLGDNDGDVSSHASLEEEDRESGSASESDIYNQQSKSTKKRKRNDPDAFSTSISKILSSHLTTTARKDPILIRSKKSIQSSIDNSKLEAKAKRLLSLEKKKLLDKGRIKDIIPKSDSTGDDVKKVLEREKALRKVAQRGVIKLFNAVRAAQVGQEQAMKEAKGKGVIGIEQRQQKVTDMSKQSFLNLIKSGSSK